MIDKIIFAALHFQIMALFVNVIHEHGPSNNLVTKCIASTA